MRSGAAWGTGEVHWRLGRSIDVKIFVYFIILHFLQPPDSRWVSLLSVFPLQLIDFFLTFAFFTGRKGIGAP